MTSAPIMMNSAKRVAICLVIAAAATASGCETGGETTVPQELVGTWRTTAPAYADRVLRLSHTGVVFGRAEGTEPAHPVRRVMSVPDRDTVLYTIVYSDPADQEFSFYYDPAGGGTITLKNQRQFQWKKE